MRIRKNMKLSSLLLATTGNGGDKPETYLCHFNQSPWDVIPVTSSGDGDCTAELTNLLDSSWFLPSPPLIHKVDGEDNVKVSLGNSNGAAKRLNLNDAAEDYESERSPRSDNSDKKSKSVELESPDKSSGDENQVAVSMPAPPKRGRPRGTGKKARASTAVTNPYEFYYYSGFGPRWGRKRGGDNNNIGTGENIMRKKSSSSSHEEDEDSDEMAANGSGSLDEDFEVVDRENDHGKEKTMMRKPKRGRKPVKERSLKSLM